MTAVCKITILFIFFFRFRFWVEQKHELYNILFENNSVRRTRSSAAVHANFAMGFDERATQRNWLLLSAAATSPLSASFRQAGKYVSTSPLRRVSILPRSGDDEIRFPQWWWWNTAPAYYYAIGNLSFHISLPLALSIYIYLYISIHFSLFPRGRSYTHVYMILSLTPYIHRPLALCVCVCHVFFTYTLAPRRRS